MSEHERAEALKSVQLELFTLEAEYRYRRLELKRKLVLIKNCGVKTCRKCREEMSVEQFYTDKRYADSRYPYCIECVRNRRSKRAA